MDWQATAESQALIIEELSELCKSLLMELSQHKNIEEEEKRLREIIEE